MWKFLHVNYPSFLSVFNQTWMFWAEFRKKKSQISSFFKIHPVGAELFHKNGHTDGRTNMTKLEVAFRNFANEPNNRQNYTTLYFISKNYIHWNYNGHLQSILIILQNTFQLIPKLYTQPRKTQGQCMLFSPNKIYVVYTADIKSFSKCDR